MFYVSGVLKNRAYEKSSGAWACGKPAWAVVQEAVKRNMEAVKNHVIWNFDAYSGVLSYSMLDHSETRLTRLHVEEYVPDQVLYDTKQKIVVREIEEQVQR